MNLILFGHSNHYTTLDLSVLSLPLSTSSKECSGQLARVRWQQVIQVNHVVVPTRPSQVKQVLWWLLLGPGNLHSIKSLGSYCWTYVGKLHKWLGSLLGE